MVAWSTVRREQGAAGKGMNKETRELQQVQMWLRLRASWLFTSTETHLTGCFRWVNFTAWKICLSKAVLNKDINEGENQSDQQWLRVVAWRPQGTMVGGGVGSTLKGFLEQMERRPFLPPSAPLSLWQPRDMTNHFWLCIRIGWSKKPTLICRKTRNVEFRKVVFSAQHTTGRNPSTQACPRRDLYHPWDERSRCGSQDVWERRKQTL